MIGIEVGIGEIAIAAIGTVIDRASNHVEREALIDDKANHFSIRL